MTKKDKAQQYHDDLVDMVSLRLEDKLYDSVETNVCDAQYEYDIIAKRGDYTHFYEIKTGVRFKKAQKQFNNYCIRHPEENIKGIYVSPIFGVKRLKNE